MRPMQHVRLYLAALLLAAIAPLAHGQAITDVLENRLVDFLFRGQTIAVGTSTATWDAAPPLWVGLYLNSANCTDAGGGTEVSGGSYARVRVPASGAPTLSNAFSGTQGTASTTASSGTGGLTALLNAATFPSATADWGTVGSWALLDASTGGSMLICTTLTATRTISTGATASFAAGALTVTFQ